MESRARLLCAVIALMPAATGGLACSPRTLIAVDPCPVGLTSVDGAACQTTYDAMPLDQPAIPPLRSGLVGLWHLDESPAPEATMARDDSGNGNHGTLVKLDPATVWVTDGGRVGGALAVEGQGYVLVPLSDSIASIVSAVTISAWVYLEGTIGVNAYGTTLSRQIGTTIDQYYHLALLEGGASSLYISPADMATAHPTGSAVSVKTWTHLAGTYDGSTAILYVDGKQVLSLAVTGTFVPDTTPVIIGGNGNNRTVSEFFPGRIDEIALYNRALDAAEIQQLANAVSF
jgi:hypothetical protein